MNKNLEKTVQKWLETRFINSAFIVSKLSVFSVRANKKAITAGGWTETERKKAITDQGTCKQ